MTVPQQKPHKSYQAYETPWDFVHRVERRLGIAQFAVDLAASVDNKKASEWLAEDDDALNSQWHWGELLAGGWGWLNPPYTDITTWAKKCDQSSLSGAKIALLVPASVGSNWYRDYVHNRAQVWALNGRISFDNVGPYPKDLILCLYGLPPGFDVWDWRK